MEIPLAHCTGILVEETEPLLEPAVTVGSAPQEAAASYVTVITVGFVVPEAVNVTEVVAELGAVHDPLEYVPTSAEKLVKLLPVIEMLVIMYDDVTEKVKEPPEPYTRKSRLPLLFHTRVFVLPFVKLIVTFPTVYVPDKSVPALFAGLVIPNAVNPASVLNVNTAFVPAPHVFPAPIVNIKTTLAKRAIFLIIELFVFIIFNF